MDSDSRHCKWLYPPRSGFVQPPLCEGGISQRSGEIMSCAEIEGATLWAAWPRATWTSRRAYESRRTLGASKWVCINPTSALRHSLLFEFAT